MEYKIIDAEPRHLQQLAEIEKECFSMPMSMENLKSQLPDNMHRFILAESPDGQVLGYVGMMFVLDEGYISNVAVKSQYRKNHIGSALIEELIKIGRELELSFISLEVRASNAPAQALYRKFGFENAGYRKNYYDFPKEDAIIMTKFKK